MKRRQFMKYSAAAGLSLLTPLHKHAIASDNLREFNGPFWMTINLRGAWDSTLFCDPKGDVTDGSGRGPVNRYHRDDILTHQHSGGTLPLAPGDFYYQNTLDGRRVHVLDHLEAPGLTLINGIDAGLTSHPSGEQLAMSGSTAANFPTLAALVAYHRLVDRPDPPNGPMPLLSFGGYDGTANLLPATRLANLSALTQITRPDHIGPASEGARIHGARVTAAIDAALEARRLHRESEVRLPDKVAAMSQLFVARDKEEHVGQLLAPGGFDPNVFEALPQDGLEQQAYVALKTFSAGLGVSANLLLSGWDSHSDNDARQHNRLNLLFRGLVYIKDLAEQLGITQQLNIVVGSDFGRTTFYKSRNADQSPTTNSGKDHHPVTSAMTMLWGTNHEQGIRLIGETDDAVIAKGLNTDLSIAQDGGTILTPAMIHHELRRIAGLSGSEVDQRFPLDIPSTPLTLWG